MEHGDPQDDIDARFAQIVAGLDDPEAPADPTDTRTTPPGPVVVPAQWRMPSADQSTVLDDEAGFVPPEPQPLPADDPGFWSILTCLIGGPLWLLYLFLFDRYARPLWWALASATVLVGVVLLLWRQPAHREDPDDDGAVL